MIKEIGTSFAARTGPSRSGEWYEGGEVALGNHERVLTRCTQDGCKSFEGGRAHCPVPC